MVIGNQFDANAQRPWKEYLIPGTAMFVAGFLDGTDQALIYHYDGFKKAFPNASDKFWNPAISYKNKFKNFDEAQGEAFFGSTSIFVEFTDGHHLLRLTRVALDLTSVTYCMSKQHVKQNKVAFLNWKTVLQDFVVLSAIRTIGFQVAYNGAFNANPVFLAK